MAIEIEKYVAPAKQNRYDADVKALAEAGPDSLGKVLVPAGEKVASAKLTFQAAAKAAGYSARVKLEETAKDGSTVLGFVLFDKRKPRGSGADAAESGSVETEVAEVTTKD